MRSAPILASLLLAACTARTAPEPEIRVDPATVIARGDYLANHVSLCTECHTPRNEDGTLDLARRLGGNERFVDLVPEDEERGLLPAPNLTPGPAGILAVSDDQLRRAIVEGVGVDGRVLSPLMPYIVYASMRSEDVDAIIAYLRSVDAVDLRIPPRQELPVPVPERPASPLPEARIPHSTLPADHPERARADQGRYLAAIAGSCLECHTPEVRPLSGELDLSRAFGGGRVFPSAMLGIPSPPFPPEIVSPNITPDGTGLPGVTPEIVRAVLHRGLDPQGGHICPPMPSGPQGLYAGLTAEDALAIGVYVATLPPVATARYPDCVAPGPPPGP